MKFRLSACLTAALLTLTCASMASAQSYVSPLQLPGTEWVGKETLGNYGDIRFQFQSAGKVFMIDKDGKTPGKYTQEGVKVTLSFYNDSVLYVGRITGQTMAGPAQNGKKTWSFLVRLNEGIASTPVNPAPLPAFNPVPPSPPGQINYSW